ncbi:hypothetical protein U0070_014957 [Myodes glareolus]|uniref:Cytochrome b/b6 N-terminal region profile domain-containing protein n=1 Tax=Myodes glareolus TaxID=447135 RepID=A0AAW0I2E9_MYOGA
MTGLSFEILFPPLFGGFNRRHSPLHVFRVLKFTALCAEPINICVNSLKAGKSSFMVRRFGRHRIAFRSESCSACQNINGRKSDKNGLDAHRESVNIMDFSQALSRATGAGQVDKATLTQFFAFHFILPFITTALVLVHLLFLYKTSSNNPSGLNSDADQIPFHPYYTIKDFSRRPPSINNSHNFGLIFFQIFSETQIITPQQIHLTPRHTLNQNDIFYSPMLFFDLSLTNWAEKEKAKKSQSENC